MIMEVVYTDLKEDGIVTILPVENTINSARVLPWKGSASTNNKNPVRFGGSNK